VDNIFSIWFIHSGILLLLQILSRSAMMVGHESARRDSAINVSAQRRGSLSMFILMKANLIEYDRWNALDFLSASNEFEQDVTKWASLSVIINPLGSAATCTTLAISGRSFFAMTRALIRMSALSRIVSG
jgi:hypothetical protein